MEETKRKPALLFPRTYWLSTALQLRLHCPLYAGVLSAWALMGKNAAAIAVSSWVISQLSGKRTFIVIIYHFWHLESFYPLFQNGPQALGDRSDIWVLFKDKHSAVSHSLHFGQVWLSGLITICAWRSFTGERWEMHQYSFCPMFQYVLWALGVEGAALCQLKLDTSQTLILCVWSVVELCNSLHLLWKEASLMSGEKHICLQIKDTYLEESKKLHWSRDVLKVIFSLGSMASAVMCIWLCLQHLTQVPSHWSGVRTDTCWLLPRSSVLFLQILKLNCVFHT